MSLEDVFGSDLEDSDNEDYKPSSEQTEIKDLFGESGSEGEDDVKQQQSLSRKQRVIESDDDDEDDQSNSFANREDDDVEEKDDEDEKSPVQDSLTHAHLFGDELSSDEEKENQRDVPSPQQTESRLEEGGEGGEEEEEEETRIDVTIPYCRVPLGSELFFSKLPNFLSVETKPFDPALYEEDVEEDDILDEEGRTRLKLKVENAIRWRFGKDSDGNEIKESNARIVRWSDGTMSLLVGQEVFDIQKTKVEGNFNHLFVQQGTGLQGQAVFKEKITFRPYSTASQTHKKMLMSIADRENKSLRIRMMAPAGIDPEAKRHELIKKEEEKLRVQLRLDNHQRRMRERSQAKGLSVRYLEGDDEDEDLEQSLLKIKKKYKRELARGPSYASDDEDGEDEEEEEKSIDIAGLESDDEEADEERLINAKKGIDLEAEPSEEISPRKRMGSDTSLHKKDKKKRKKIIESSDEESD